MYEKHDCLIQDLAGKYEIHRGLGGKRLRETQSSRMKWFEVKSSPKPYIEWGSVTVHYEQRDKIALLAINRPRMK